MKTAISVPDEIFEEADRLARQRGMSRSELYARAVAEYVKGERFAGVRERLDSVYGSESNSSLLDPALGEMQAQSLPKEQW
jgi:metal-responsive CopG/Arc/MetJ family transcriptional regulator